MRGGNGRENQCEDDEKRWRRSDELNAWKNKSNRDLNCFIMSPLDVRN